MNCKGIKYEMWWEDSMKNGGVRRKEKIDILYDDKCIHVSRFNFLMAVQLAVSLTLQIIITTASKKIMRSRSPQYPVKQCNTNQ